MENNDYPNKVISTITVVLNFLIKLMSIASPLYTIFRKSHKEQDEQRVPHSATTDGKDASGDSTNSGDQSDRSVDTKIDNSQIE